MPVYCIGEDNMDAPDQDRGGEAVQHDFDRAAGNQLRIADLIGQHLQGRLWPNERR